MRILTVLTILLLISCDQRVDLPHLNEDQWKQDLKGCDGFRLKLIDELEKDKHLLKGLSQGEVISVLGRPDENELFKRNQKFFIYSISAFGCETISNQNPRKYLSIRFNATGLAKEIIVYTE